MSTLVIDTPLRAAAMGVMFVAAGVLAAGLITGRRYRGHVLLLTGVALALTLVSEALQ